ncbi:MAG: DUF494 family protein [Candidatus Latescibacterota bacterium]
MDLVVLVTELTKKNDKSYREINNELNLNGYSTDEIEQARFWLAANSMSRDQNNYPIGRNVFRVLNKWEQMSLDSESYGYLLRLWNLGIVDIDRFEKIMLQLIPIGSEKIPFNEVKAIASAVVFNQLGRDYDSDLYNDFEDEFSTS